MKTKKKARTQRRRRKRKVLMDGARLQENQRKNRYCCKGGDKVCGLAITSKEDCIRCDYCKDWYHPKCQELTVNAFRAVSKYDLWVCTHCKPNVMALMKAGKGLETCIERSENKNP